MAVLHSRGLRVGGIGGGGGGRMCVQVHARRSHDFGTNPRDATIQTIRVQSRPNRGYRGMPPAACSRVNPWVNLGRVAGVKAGMFPYELPV